jgi:hypothetical protein
VRPANFGPPRGWTQEFLETIGVVFAGIISFSFFLCRESKAKIFVCFLNAGLKPEAISSINPEAMQGLQPHAVKVLPPSSFLALTPNQISRMSYNAAKSVLPVQKNSLNPVQLEELEKLLHLQNDEFNIAAMSPDDTRDEDTRELPNNGTEPVGGRSKNGDDNNNDPADTSTEAPGKDSNGTSTTEVPEFKGETGPKSDTVRTTFSTLSLIFMIFVSKVVISL